MILLLDKIGHGINHCENEEDLLKVFSFLKSVIPCTADHQRSIWVLHLLTFLDSWLHSKTNFFCRYKTFFTELNSLRRRLMLEIKNVPGLIQDICFSGTGKTNCVEKENPVACTTNMSPHKIRSNEIHTTTSIKEDSDNLGSTSDRPLPSSSQSCFDKNDSHTSSSCEKEDSQFISVSSSNSNCHDLTDLSNSKNLKATIKMFENDDEEEEEEINQENSQSKVSDEFLNFVKTLEIPREIRKHGLIVDGAAMCQTLVVLTPSSGMTSQLMEVEFGRLRPLLKSPQLCLYLYDVQFRMWRQGIPLEFPVPGFMLEKHSWRVAFSNMNLYLFR